MSLAQVHRGTKSPAPLSAPARGGHYFLGTTSFFVCVTARFPAALDRVTIYALRLFLDLDVSSIRFIWILPLLAEVDPVRKDGVGIKVKVNGVVVISLEETSKNLCSEFRVLLEDSY